MVSQACSLAQSTIKMTEVKRKKNEYKLGREILRVSTSLCVCGAAQSIHYSRHPPSPPQNILAWCVQFCSVLFLFFLSLSMLLKYMKNGSIYSAFVKVDSGHWGPHRCWHPDCSSGRFVQLEQKRKHRMHCGVYLLFGGTSNHSFVSIAMHKLTLRLRTVAHDRRQSFRYSKSEHEVLLHFQLCRMKQWLQV